MVFNIEDIKEKTKREAQAEESKKYVERKYVDATPDGNYAVRILRAHRDDCNIAWSDNTAGLRIQNPLVKLLNKLQAARAKELDNALSKFSQPTKKYEKGDNY